MASASLVKDLVEVNIPLSSIFLDPNNPRFVAQDWTYIPDNQVDDDAIQNETRLKMIREFGVEKLKMNMEVNGFLPIDRVIVRQFKDNKYVVLEGNRRICAAKMISQFAGDGTSVNEDVLDSLKNIPCLQYIGGEKDAAWIFQGLRHITGINDWSAFNKAKLLVEQMEIESLSLTEVGKRFGLTPYGAGQWVRGYYAFKQAREESDFINEVDEKSYPYLQELFSRSSASVREWLEWDEAQYKFRNALNFNEFIGWIYPRTTINDVESNIMENNQSRGDFEKRALRRSDDTRQLAFLIREDKQAFEKFRREFDIERAYSEAIQKKYEREIRETIDQTEVVFKIISECKIALDNIPHKMLKNDDTKNRLMQSLQDLETTIKELKQ
jgi:hypothetical protein